MKFICPSCKAKYQIADEKVLGKSVRMKCRKCANVIQIGSEGASLVDARAEAAPAQAPARAAVPARSAQPVGAARPMSPARPAPGAPRTGVPLGRAAIPGTARAAAPAPRPRPGKAASLPPPAVKPTASPRPAPVAPPVHAKAKPQPSPASAPEVPQEEEEATRVADSNVLASAFSAAVAAPVQSAASPVEEWFVGINGVPVGPLKLADVRGKAKNRSITKESLVWKEGFEEWKTLGAFPELSALVDEATAAGRASDAPMPLAAAPLAAPAAAPVQASAPAVGEQQSAEELAVLAGLSGRRGLSVAQIFAMVVAVAFGLTIGFVVFSSSQETKEVVKYVEVPSQDKSTHSAEGEDAGAAVQTEPEKAEEEEAKGQPKAGSGKVGARPAGPAETTKGEAAKGGLKGLSGLSGLAAGPKGPSGTQKTGSTSGKPLDSSAVQSTVSRYTGSVKRSCWQPALDTRDKNAPTAARVGVTITVAGSGRVQNVSTTGDPRGYRGLANCISSRVRGWQFPASSGTTTVNVPFVFAAQ